MVSVGQAEAAAKDLEIATQREQFRRLREGEVAEFDDIKKNLVEESRRVMGAAVWDAKQAEEAAVRARWDEKTDGNEQTCGSLSCEGRTLVVGLNLVARASSPTGRPCGVERYRLSLDSKYELLVNMILCTEVIHVVLGSLGGTLPNRVSARL